MTQATQAAAAADQPIDAARAAANAAAGDFGTRDIDNAADVIVNTTHWFGRFFENLFANLTWENVSLQVLIVVMSFVLGIWLAHRARERLEKFRPKAAAAGVLSHLKHLFIGLLENVAFGLIAGSILALLAYAMVTIGGYSAESLVICRIFYNLFYAYSLLSIVIAFMQTALGGNIITPSLRRSITVVFWSLAVLQFFGVLGQLVDILDTTRIPIGKGDMTLWKLVIAIFSVLLTLAVANWISNIIGQVIHGARTLSANQKVVLTRIVSVGLMVLAVIIGLGTVGIDLTILSVFGGALGVGLGFGLQKIASNYVSGFIILLDKSVKIGDLVVVGGFRGKVTEINTRFTVVRSADGVENIVPNETFVTTAVQNLSYTDEATTVYVDISVAYDADVDRALEIMLEEGRRERPRIAKGRNPWAYVDGFGDPGINLKLAFWLADPVNGAAGIRTEIELAIYKRFNEEGIRIPYNRLEVVLQGAPAVVKVENVTK